MKKRLLAVAAYVLPTFPLGFIWHLSLFADYYKSLQAYREDIIVPFGIASMLIQGMVWSVVYERMFAGERIVSGALKFPPSPSRWLGVSWSWPSAPSTS